MPKHSARRNIRGGVAAGAVLAAVTLTAGGVAYANASPGPLPPTCADALTAYNAAQSKANQDAIARNKAQRDYDQAKAILAKYDATHGGTGQPPVVDADRAKLVADVQQTSDTLRAAQDKYNTDAAAAADAEAQVDKPITDGGCAGPAGTPGLPGAPGTPGSNGKDGSDGKDGVSGTAGKDGIDAKIILAPGMCAEAKVTPDPAKLVRVVTLIPCPPVVPPAPPVAPTAGQNVTVVSPAAPAPQVQEAHLPVTH